MENSITVCINGTTIVDATDTDEKAIALTLHAVAESIERFGLKASLKVLERSNKLKEALFVDAKCGHALLSTVVELTASNDAQR